MADYALIVGVEEYEAMPRLQGPALDALRFALWLNAQGVPAANILLFLNKCDAWRGRFENQYQEVLEKVRGAGITVRGDPGYESIERAWREELRTVDAAGGTMWLYWSGHGVTFPESRQAVLCCNRSFGDPTYVFLSDLRDLFRTAEFRHFARQRLIVDACSLQVSFEDLRISAVRDPLKCKPQLDVDQILLNAVAPGRIAEAGEDGGLFTRVLLKLLEEERAWPQDIRPFYSKLADEVTRLAGSEKKRPRLTVRSLYFDDDRLLACPRKDYAEELIGVLLACGIAFEDYEGNYLRTIGSVLSDPEARHASSISAMVDYLSDLKEERDFGGYPQLLMEFLVRIARAFPERSALLRDWLSQQLPDAARITLEGKLNKEQAAMILHLLVVESALDEGFPATLDASLSDAGFSQPLLTFRYDNIGSRTELEKVCRKVLLQARHAATRAKVSLTVQVFANPPLLCVPYHALPVDPDDEDDTLTFGGQHAFVLRSRARITEDERYDLDNWRKKARAITLQSGRNIVLQPAPEWASGVGDTLEQVDGMLVIRELFENGGARPQKLLKAALKRGLPLLSWRIQPPPAGDWSEFDRLLKGLLEGCNSVNEAPHRLKDQRKSEAWARQTALFWDNEDVPPFLVQPHEEPIQE